MELLQTQPSEADYTPLAEHESQTPASFYSGPAVLHYVSRGATLTARRSDLRSISALAKLTGTDAANESQQDEDDDAETTISGIDIWIASDKLVLARPSVSLSLAVPYRSIALHAVASAGLYLQLSTDSDTGDENEDSTIELTLTPASTNGTTAEESARRPVDLLFQALSACADLHPDPHEPGDEDDDESEPAFAIHTNGDTELYVVTAPPATNGAGGQQPALPPPFPGSSGWITAENMHEYFDEEGNWKGEGTAPGLLGPGAGTIRERDDDDAAEDGSASNQRDEAEDSKWQRTG